MKKLNILYICYEDLTGYNGAIRHVTEIVKGLARQGHKVTLSVPRLNRIFKTPLLADVRLRIIPTIRLRGVRPLSYLFFSVFLLPWAFWRVRPDVVYTRDIKFTLLSVLLARIFRVPCVIEVNNLLDEAQKIRKVGNLTYAILKFFQSWNLRNAGRIVTVTSGIKDEMITGYGMPPEKISIITNGVDLTRFYPIPRAEAQARVNLSAVRKYVGFVGGLFPWHGLDQLVAAAPQILQKVPDAQFVIVGSGMMENELKKLVAEKGLEKAFIFTGSVPFDQVPDYVNSFSLCVVFFKKIRKDPGDPIKLYEYLACGRPVVASDVPGYGDQVEAIEAGLSADSEDAGVTADAIIHILKDEERAASMGKKGAEHALKYFSWDRKVRETEMIFQDLLQ